MKFENNIVNWQVIAAENCPIQAVKILTNLIGQINCLKNNNSDDYCLTTNNPDQLWNNNWFCCQNYHYEKQ